MVYFITTVCCLDKSDHSFLKSESLLGVTKLDRRRDESHTKSRKGQKQNRKILINHEGDTKYLLNK